ARRSVDSKREFEGPISSNDASAHPLHTNYTVLLVIPFMNTLWYIGAFQRRLSPIGVAAMPKKIFIIDDSKIVRELVRRYLESRLEYIVCSEAADGQDAIDHAREVGPDL